MFSYPGRTHMYGVPATFEGFLAILKNPQLKQKLGKNMSELEKAIFSPYSWNCLIFYLCYDKNISITYDFSAFPDTSPECFSFCVTKYFLSFVGASQSLCLVEVKRQRRSVLVARRNMLIRERDKEVVNCATRWSLLLLIGVDHLFTTQRTEKYSTAMC